MPQSAAWVFTWNNPSLTPDEFQEHVRPLCTFLIFQEEYVSVRHYQGYVEFSSRKRLETVRSQFPHGIHFEPRRGTQDQAIAYASKEESRVSGPFRLGEPSQAHKGQGTRTDLHAAIATLKEGGLKRVRQDHPDAWVKFHRGLQSLANLDLPERANPPEVHLLFGPPGCGKTRAFYDLPSPDKGVVPCTDGFWFDGYEGQSWVLLDDFDGRASKWTLQNLLRVIDRYPIHVPVKGGFTAWAPEVIYVTTNIHPLEWYTWQQREQQQGALIRRFTHLHWWKSAGADPILCVPRTPDWEHFWLGRQGVQDQLDYAESMEAGQLISRPATSDYFNF